MLNTRILLSLIAIIIILITTACEADREPNVTPVETQAPTATPVVINTPTPHVVPVATDAPTATAVPTPTPMPEPTPTAMMMEPTTMPEPTATPVPTATPRPTATPQPTPTPPITMTLGCNDELFKQEVLELSEDNQGSVTIRILKLHEGAKAIERTNRVLRCMGEAKLSRGGDRYITYHIEIDRDGDQFIGYEIGDLISPPTPTPTARPTATPMPTPTPEPVLGSRQNPVPFGLTVEVKNEESTDHWEVTVMATIPDATKIVLDENPYNDPPEEGNQFYIVRVRAKYLGPDSTEFDGSYRLRVLGNSGVVYTTFENSCSFYGDPDRLPDPELFTNGTVEGNVCWEIASADADSLMMFLEPESFYLGGSRAWFSLKE